MAGLVVARTSSFCLVILKRLIVTFYDRVMGASGGRTNERGIHIIFFMDAIKSDTTSTTKKLW